MLSDSIRNLRKENNMSQDELAERLGVSRQSISLWETGQTQPTIENIIGLAKIFNVSSDVILDNTDNSKSVQEVEPGEEKQKGRALFIIPAIIAAAIIAGIVLLIFLQKGADSVESPDVTENVTQTEVPQVTEENTVQGGENEPTVTEKPNGGSVPASVTNPPKKTEPPKKEVDLFACCKNYAIKKGHLNGDYTIYQQPSSKYGGNENEYFSISYWAGSDMVEFCLHCPLSDTQSINFYLRMRGGYNKQYEYLSSKYYRDTGKSIRDVYGYIDPTTFYDGYPLSFAEYNGSVDGQTEFMEESRVGICDLIRCLKRFVEVENMECDFSDFDFEKF